jgi:hypothetical protein
MLWKERNAITFNRRATPAAQLDQQIADECNDWCMAGYRQLMSLL